MRNIVLHIHIFLAVALIALVSAGCRDRHAAELLARADAVMETAPDSARVLLDSIEPSGLGGADVALYAVLDAQARHKLDLAAPSDSLLTIAVDRYTSYGPDSLLMKALFYRAVGYQQAGDIKQAAADATGSWEVADESENHYWIAKSAELVADLANDISNYKEELHWRQLAAENYRLAGINYNYLTSMCDVATAYLNLHHAERALAIDDSLRMTISDFPNDTDLRIYHAYTSLFIQNHYGSIARADTLYQFLSQQDSTFHMYPYVGLIKANILLHSCRYQESRALLDTLEKTLCSRQERSMLHMLYYQLAKETDDIVIIKRMVDSLLNDQNILISHALSQPVTTSQRDYFHMQAHSYKEDRQKAETRGWWIFGIAVSLLIGSGTLYLVWIQRNKQKLNEKIRQVIAVSSQLETSNKERKEIESELEGLRKTHTEMEEELSQISQRGTEEAYLNNSLRRNLREQERHIGRLTKKLDTTSLRLMDVYTDKWATINMLCTQFNSGDSKNAVIIMANISRELEKMKTNDFYRGLESDINRNMDGLMSRFRTQCAGLPEDMVKIAMLFFAGFSSSAVALLSGISQRTVSNRKKRILQAITTLDPDNKKLFISRFLR